MEMLAMANDDDQLIRPTFPSSNTGEGYNLQVGRNKKSLVC